MVITTHDDKVKYYQNLMIRAGLPEEDAKLIAKLKVDLEEHPDPGKKRNPIGAFLSY